MHTSKSRKVCASSDRHTSIRNDVRLCCGMQIEKNGCPPSLRVTSMSGSRRRTRAGAANDANTDAVCGLCDVLEHRCERALVIPVFEYPLPAALAHGFAFGTVPPEPLQ